MIDPQLLQRTIQHFQALQGQAFMINPSIPILYFGDENAYRNSQVKVITVGKNPSLNEFRDSANETFSIAYRFPNWNEENLTTVLNEYFTINPLRQWFLSFEPLLNGFNCSYYPDNNYDNRALHTDICSPIPTDPTWTGLEDDQRELLFTEGLGIWNELVSDLSPDYIIVSIPRNIFLQNISGQLGEIIYTIQLKKDGKPSPSFRVTTPHLR